MVPMEHGDKMPSRAQVAPLPRRQRYGHHRSLEARGVMQSRGVVTGGSCPLRASFFLVDQRAYREEPGQRVAVNGGICPTRGGFSSLASRAWFSLEYRGSPG
jgi:hypothetical protein